MHIKTTDEINLIKQGAKILTEVHRELAKKALPGITTLALDTLAETIIRDHGATPSFKGYQGFPATLCTSVNQQVIHAIPSNYRLKEGDILSIDCGVYYKGYHSDAANTHPIGNVSQELLNLLAETKAALYLGIEKAAPDNRMGDVSHAIQQHLQQHNYGIVREYGGHGIGKSLHEDPHIPNYGLPNNGIQLQNGMVLAIEPIASTGSGEIVDDGGWSVLTKDNAPTAHFEHTVAIIDNHPHILTEHL